MTKNCVPRSERIRTARGSPMGREDILLREASIGRPENAAPVAALPLPHDPVKVDLAGAVIQGNADEISAFEPVAHDRFDDPVFARIREAAADAEVELPVRRHVEIESGEQDVMLFG